MANFKSRVFSKMSLFSQRLAMRAGHWEQAQAAHYISFDQPWVINYERDAMKGSYLEPTFSDLDVELTAKKYKAVYKKFDNLEELTKETAQILADGNVVGWVQGRIEFGPRALGARTILGDPRNAEMQKKLNVKIKYRESFRPFAPSVLAEKVSDYFDYEGTSP
jgi:carbamoyltransferase